MAHTQKFAEFLISSPKVIGTYIFSEKNTAPDTKLARNLCVAIANFFLWETEMQGNRFEVQPPFSMHFVCLHQRVHSTTQLSATPTQATEILSQRKTEYMRRARSKNYNKKSIFSTV